MDSLAILQAFRSRGDLVYQGEGVTQLQHAWQCGQLAAQAHAVDSLRLAAWLHDLGHLLSPMDGTPTLALRNDEHEEVAARLLAGCFGEPVAGPVRLHVLAKRYLVGVHPVYADRLSADSVRSLALQGGPMTQVQAQDYRRRPWADAALRLRMWDDVGKLPNWRPPSTEAALDELAALMDRLGSGCAQTG